MRTVWFAVLAAVLLQTPASGQIPTVGMFTDATGTDCSIVAGNSGMLQVFVFVSSPVTGVTAVEFSAPPPGCFNATYLGETSPFLSRIGNSQTGIAIGLGGCYGTEAHVLTLNYMLNGTTPPCCIYPILPSPAYENIRLVNCDDEIELAVSIQSSVNGDNTCFCGINPAPTEPANPVPDDGRVAVDVVTVLQWESTDPRGDPLTYDVYFGMEADPPLVAAGLTEAEFTPDILPFNTKHYWKVAVKDNHGNEVFGPEWTFTTQVSSSSQLVAPEIVNYCGPAASDTVLVDILIINSDHPIDRGGFDLAYNNSLLTYVGCAQGDLTSSWPVFSCTDAGSAVHVWGSGPAAIPAGSNGSFVQLKFLSDCCGTDSLITPTFCPENTTDDMRALWPVCGGFQCAVFNADGDVNGDGGITPGDALCAFTGYLSFPEPPGDGCGTAGWDVRGDVDCSGTVTPGDALCIFHSWLDGSCAFCEGGSLASMEHRAPPSVTVSDISRNGDETVVLLAVEGIGELNAFGFDVRFPDVALSGMSVFPAPLTHGFDQLLLKSHGQTFARVGAYTTSPAIPGSATDLLELRFTRQSGGRQGNIVIGSFVDDLAGAPAVTIKPVESHNDSPPITNYTLYQNHPNPFNPDTEIRYEIPDKAAIERVTLTIYNVRGKRVRQLVNKDQGGGLYRQRWDGRNETGTAASSGVYFYVLRAAERTITRKMVLLR